VVPVMVSSYLRRRVLVKLKPSAGNNPEQLLALGYGACFLGALRLQAKNKKIDISDDVKVRLLGLAV